MIQSQCKYCEKKFKVKDEFAGKKIRCRQCNEVISIPSSPESTVPKSAKVVRPSPPAVIPELTFDEFSDDYSEPQLPARTKKRHVQLGDPYQKSLVHIQPTSNIQVNVSQSNAANSLGISSLVLGLLSFVICWMPGIGQIISGLGLLLGLVGFILAVVRGGSGIGYSISGSALNALSLVVGIVFLSALSSTSKQLSEMSAQSSNTVPQAVPSQPDSNKKAVDSTKPDANATPKAELTDDLPVAPPAIEPPMVAVTPPAEPPAPMWHPAKESLQLGNIRLKLSKVVIGNVPLSERIGDDSVSEDVLLTIYLELTNTSKTQKIPYTSWMDDYASLRDIDCELTDNFDNDYRKINFGSLTTVKGISTDSSIYPGKMIKDAVVFELPVTGIEFLHLRLSSKGVGQDGEFRLHISPEMISTKLGTKSR